MYGGKTLRGEEIIDSFEQNHEQAKKRFDSIKYIDGEVTSQDGGRITVQVKDELTLNGQKHTYQDRLIITCNDQQGPGSVISIENRPFPEERKKLQEFLQA